MNPDNRPMQQRYAVVEVELHNDKRKVLYEGKELIFLSHRELVEWAVSLPIGVTIIIDAGPAGGDIQRELSYFIYRTRRTMWSGATGTAHIVSTGQTA